MDNNSRIFLTYQLGGEYLLQKGEYKEARVSKGPEIIYDCGAKGPQCIVDKPMKVIKEPKYDAAKQIIVLSTDFLNMCLERPENPFKGKNDSFYKWLKSPKGKFWHNFNKLSEHEKINTNLKFYVQDITGIEDPDFSYEII